MTYRLIEVPVDGGTLVAGAWNEEAAGTVLAFHGITASHVSWRAVARQLGPSRTFIAPDLRGRGGSRALVGPFGMAQHAKDALAVLAAVDVAGPVDIVGHSMGGFVAMRFAADYPERVRSITLIDGGIPLRLPVGIPIADLMKASLGPALARLEQPYPTREAYRDFWRAHPAFAGEWSDDVEAYVDYDLVGTEPNLRASASAAAALGDAVEQGEGTVADQPWATVTQPVTFLRAPRGLLNADPLYTPDVLADFASRHPLLSVIEVPDVNHYTIVLNSRGAGAIAAAITQANITKAKELQ
jgi:pimeloyl-ACP methyl ester carboxylesterase